MLKLLVLTCVIAAVSAGVVAPSLAYTTSFAYTAPLAYAAPVWPTANYRGPLSLAPGQPANVLAADGRPLDTLDVNLDRSAHYFAKAANGVHLLKKRSVLAPVVPVATVAHASLIAPAHVGLSRIAPFTRLTPYTAYSPYTTYW